MRRRQKRRVYFNSRPSARGDFACCFLVFCDFYFNSRPSARGDLLKRDAQAANQPYFNSRPSARGDWASATDAGNQHISIHAPPRGATKGRNRGIHGGKYFNSRPSARGDFPPATPRLQAEYFNSRPSARGDDNDAYLSRLLNLFQFTPLREGRRDNV